MSYIKLEAKSAPGTDTHNFTELKFTIYKQNTLFPAKEKNSIILKNQNSNDRFTSPSLDIRIIVAWVAKVLVRFTGTIDLRPLFGGETPNSPLFAALSKADLPILRSLGELKMVLLSLSTIDLAPNPLFPRSFGFLRMSL